MHFMISARRTYRIVPRIGITIDALSLPPSRFVSPRAGLENKQFAAQVQSYNDQCGKVLLR